MQLPKGIYFEHKPASGTTVVGRHAYLVYRDGEGGERVIRGGSAKDSDKGTVDEAISGAKTLVGGNITVQADIPLQKSRDKYDVEKGDTPQTRHARKLDLGGRDPETVWKDMAARAREIGKAGIDYNFVGEISMTKKGFIAQTSNSVTRAALEAGGIDPNKALPQGLKEKDFDGFENNLAKPQGGFDNKPQEKSGAEKPDKKSANEPPATPGCRSDAAEHEGADRKAARAGNEKGNDTPTAEPRAADTPEGRAMIGQLLGGGGWSGLGGEPFGPADDHDGQLVRLQ